MLGAALVAPPSRRTKGARAAVVRALVVTVCSATSGQRSQRLDVMRKDGVPGGVCIPARHGLSSDWFWQLPDGLPPLRHRAPSAVGAMRSSGTPRHFRTGRVCPTLTRIHDPSGRGILDARGRERSRRASAACPVTRPHTGPAHIRNRNPAHVRAGHWSGWGRFKARAKTHKL